MHYTLVHPVPVADISAPPIHSHYLKKKEDLKVVVSGAGAAATAITKLLLNYGIKNIIMCDRKGVIVSGREDLS